MLPVGYMYKRVSPKPDWLKTDVVEDIYSLSGCVSEDFYGWERNGVRRQSMWTVYSLKLRDTLAHRVG